MRFLRLILGWEVDVTGALLVLIVEPEGGDAEDAVPAEGEMLDGPGLAEDCPVVALLK
jgi:hypothetical protein